MVFLKRLYSVLRLLLAVCAAAHDSALLFRAVLSVGNHAVHRNFESHDRTAVPPRPSVLSTHLLHVSLHDSKC